MRPEIAQVVRRHRTNFRQNAGGQAGVLRRSRSPCVAIRPGSRSIAVHDRGPFPGQVIQPDVVQGDLVGRDAEQPGEVALEADGHVAQPDRPVPGVEQRPGDDADRVGEVDDPRVGRGPLPGAFGDVQHDRHGAQCLGEPARPGGLLADAAAFQRPGLVPLPGRLAADAQLEQHRARPVQALVQAGRPAQPGRVAVAAA